MICIQDAETRNEDQICKLVLEKQELEWQKVCIPSRTRIKIFKVTWKVFLHLKSFRNISRRLYKIESKGWYASNQNLWLLLKRRSIFTLGSTII